MRIISGKAKGTKLYTLEGLDTRPTLDRVKESMFNIINNQIPDSIVLDLFSGSGAIGLEFASRGAKKVYVCDNSKKAIDIIQKNIEKTHLSEKIEMYNCDFKNIFSKIDDVKFDIVFIDPPYKTNYIKIAIEKLLETKHIDENTLMIAETDETERVLKEIENLKIEIIDQRKYGRANLIFIKEKGL